MMAFLRRNWEYKLLSLVLSILLYFIASTQRNRSLSSTQSVQPQVVGLPLELVVKIPPPPGQVTLTGPPEELDRVRKEGIKVTVSAVGARAGKNFLPVTYVLPREARGRVALEAPPTLEVELESRLTRSIPVRDRSSGCRTRSTPASRRAVLREAALLLRRPPSTPHPASPAPSGFSRRGR